MAGGPSESADWIYSHSAAGLLRPATQTFSGLCIDFIRAVEKQLGINLNWSILILG
jgi:hypothetical protein